MSAELKNLDLPFATAPRRTILDEPAEEAVAAFTAAATAQPDEPDYRFMLGDALLRVGRLEAAAAEMRRACEAAPENAEYARTLGAVLLESGQPEEAEAALRCALKVAPQSPETLSRLAIALARTSREAEARHAADEAWRRAPASAEAGRHRGIVYWLLGETPAALAALRQATRLAPESAEGHHDLGLALEASGSAAEALVSFERTIAIDPSFLSVRPTSREIVDRCRLAAVRLEFSGRRSPADRGLGVFWEALHAVEEAGRRAARLLGRLPRFVPVLLALAVGYVGFRVVPPYAANFRLQDRLGEISRIPIRDDVEIHARLMREIEELGLQPYVSADDCTIQTRQAFRRIVCEYQRPIRLAPGLEPRVRFRARVENAVMFGPDTIFF